MIKRILIGLEGVLFFLMALPIALQADIVLKDGVKLRGPDYILEESIGERIGNNLFHDFSTFSVDLGESATFRGDSQLGNILARVTGDAASRINGRITSEVSDANLWLVNSNGIVFGENAQVDVSGSFIATTAHQLILENGTVLSTDTDINSVNIVIEDPENVVFLLSEHSQISFLNDGLVGSGEILGISSSHGSKFIAGNIEIQNANIGIEGDVSFLSGTRIDAESRHGSGNLENRINITGSDISVLLDNSASFMAEKIEIENSRISFRSTGHSSITTANFISNNMELMNDSLILTDMPSNSEHSIGPTLNFDISSSLSLMGSNLSTVVGSESTNSKGGTISITTDVLELVGENIDGFPLGFIWGENKGDISSYAGDIYLNINSRFSIYGNAGVVQQRGNGGRFSLDTKLFEAFDSDSAILFAYDEDWAPAQVTISADDIYLDNANIGNKVTNNNLGGVFDIFVDNNITLINDSSITAKTFGTANGIPLHIDAENISLLSGAFISTSTLGAGDGGDVRLNLSGQLSLHGYGDKFTSAIRSTTADLSIVREADTELAQLIGREGYGQGRGGQIRVNANSVQLQEGALIASYSSATDDAVLRVIADDQTREFHSGDAGNIKIRAEETIILSSGSSIETKAEESAGGNIDLIAGGQLNLQQANILTSTFANQTGDGGGNIRVVSDLMLLNLAEINANANAGPGGDISIDSEYILQTGNTLVTASSTRNVDGEIIINGIQQDANQIEAQMLEFLNVPYTLKQKCLYDKNGELSRFIANVSVKDSNLANMYYSGVEPLSSVHMGSLFGCESE